MRVEARWKCGGWCGCILYLTLGCLGCLLTDDLSAITFNEMTYSLAYFSMKAKKISVENIILKTRLAAALH